MLCVFSVREPTPTGAWRMHVTEEEDTFRKTQDSQDATLCLASYLPKHIFGSDVFIQKKKECISNLASLL